MYRDEYNHPEPANLSKEFLMVRDLHDRGYPWLCLEYLLHEPLCKSAVGGIDERRCGCRSEPMRPADGRGPQPEPDLYQCLQRCPDPE